MFAQDEGSEQDVACKFANHLRGPKGRLVMKHLDEGESFIVQTSKHRLLVTKKNGEPEVCALEAPTS
jgi:hypothetical protein